MIWEIAGSTGEWAGALAVVLTLFYLAWQIRESNRQNLLAAYQHTFDALNEWCGNLTTTPDLSKIVVRGRANLSALDDDEKLRFEHTYIHLLNITEAQYFQVQRTSPDEPYEKQALENLKAIVAGYFNFPGTRMLWPTLRGYVPDEVAKLVDETLQERNPVS